MIDNQNKLIEHLRPQIQLTFEVADFTHERIVVSSPNVIIMLRLDDGRKILLKGLSSYYWLGYRSNEELISHQILTAIVAKSLKLSAEPYYWYDQSLLMHDHQYSWLLLPWIEGKSRRQFTKDMALIVGKQLAKLHGLSLPHQHLKHLPRINNSIEASSWVLTLATQCNQLLENHAFETIVSHRDIHPGNMIWTSDKKFQLIDWESAGLINPFVELVSVALNISGLSSQKIELQLFETVIIAYLQERGWLPHASENHWMLLFQSWLIWYVYCMDRNQIQMADDTLESMLVLKRYFKHLKDIYLVYNN